MDYLGHYREWKGEAMTGPDAEFIAQLVEKNAVTVEERSRMKQENKGLKARIEELEGILFLKNAGTKGIRWQYHLDRENCGETFWSEEAFQELCQVCAREANNA